VGWDFLLKDEVPGRNWLANQLYMVVIYAFLPGRYSFNKTLQNAKAVLYDMPRRSHARVFCYLAPPIYLRIYFRTPCGGAAGILLDILLLLLSLILHDWFNAVSEGERSRGREQVKSVDNKGEELELFGTMYTVVARVERVRTKLESVQCNEMHPRSS